MGVKSKEEGTRISALNDNGYKAFHLFAWIRANQQTIEVDSTLDLIVIDVNNNIDV